MVGFDLILLRIGFLLIEKVICRWVVSLFLFDFILFGFERLLGVFILLDFCICVCVFCKLDYLVYSVFFKF